MLQTLSCLSAVCEEIVLPRLNMGSRVLHDFIVIAEPFPLAISVAVQAHEAAIARHAENLDDRPSPVQERWKRPPPLPNDDPIPDHKFALYRGERMRTARLLRCLLLNNGQRIPCWWAIDACMCLGHGWLPLCRAPIWSYRHINASNYVYTYYSTILHTLTYPRHNCETMYIQIPKVLM